MLSETGVSSIKIGFHCVFVLFSLIPVIFSLRTNLNLLKTNYCTVAPWYSKFFRVRMKLGYQDQGCVPLTPAGAKKFTLLSPTVPITAVQFVNKTLVSVRVEH